MVWVQVGVNGQVVVPAGGQVEAPTPRVDNAAVFSRVRALDGRSKGPFAIPSDGADCSVRKRPTPLLSHPVAPVKRSRAVRHERVRAGESRCSWALHRTWS